MTYTYTWDNDEAKAIAERYRAMPGAALPILHALQDRFGYIDDAAIPVVAETLNLSRAEIHGIVTFYHDFRRQPAGRHIMRLCRAEACQSMGGDRMIARAEERLRTKLGSTTANGNVTLEEVFCLGNCACAPALMLDGELHGRVDAARLDGLLTGLERAS